MLFPYVLLPEHSIYKLQDWIDQLFYDVWCKADPAVEYSVELLPDEIKEITLEIYHDDRIIQDYFYGPIEQVYKIFQSFDQSEKNDLAKHYQDNNEIENLCKGTAGYTPFLYSDFDSLHSELKSVLENFFKSLFDSIINLKLIQNRIGTIDEHYKDFIKINNTGKCPVCGLYSLDNEYIHTRESYDHYLPKSKYPFNSINFKNLVPICHKCNSSNKGAKDPLHKTGARRKAFYLYDQSSQNIEISISFDTQTIINLKQEDIEIAFMPEEVSEEIKTWDDLFGITKRYKSFCAGADGKYWFSQIMDECENYGKTAIEFYKIKNKEAGKHPYSDTNFLRKPYLEACYNIGLFN
ncbi:MAG: hypothetical protein KAI40_11560 [Desulfobacterales bacterium]|nr:hypothetical protein [Desulfobacterales bacterium]